MFLAHLISLIFSIAAFIVILSIVVLIHEAGHFLMAKKFRIKVEEFGFGFPPRLFGRRIGETLYSFNLLPIGGFVKLYGEDEAGAGRISLKQKEIKDLDRAFFARPAWQRASVILAGVVMNAVLAVIIFYIILFSQNFSVKAPTLVDYKFHFVNQSLNSSVFIGDVAKGGPASISGIRPYSKVVSFNGVSIKTTDEFIDDVKKNAGKTVEIEWQDEAGNSHIAVLVPRKNPPKGEGPIGVSLAGQSFFDLKYETPSQKALSGIVYPADLAFYNLKAIDTLVSTSIREKSVNKVAENVSGPLGIMVVVGSVVSANESVGDLLLQALTLTGLISVMLAFFNILPIPALDGGRLFFVLVELITRKKISARVESVFNTFGFLVLLSFLLYVTVFFDFPKLVVFLQNLFRG